MNLGSILVKHFDITEEKAEILLQDLEKVSWIYSSSGIKRAFGIWGNAIAAYLMFWCPIFVLVFLLSLLSS